VVFALFVEGKVENPQMNEIKVPTNRPTVQKKRSKAKNLNPNSCKRPPSKVLKAAFVAPAGIEPTSKV
jgi:hypothetical protein